jgi:hypothetical protein
VGRRSGPKNFVSSDIGRREGSGPQTSHETQSPEFAKEKERPSDHTDRGPLI